MPSTTAAPISPDRHEASVLSSQGKFSEAFAIIEPVVGAEPTSSDAALAETLHLAALCATGAARPDVALLLWQRCITARPDFAAALQGLASMLATLGQFAAAEPLWRRLLALEPDHADAWGNLGVVLHRQGQAQDAEHAYRAAIARAPEHVDANYNLGLLLYEARRMQEAEAAYRAAIAAGPACSPAHNNLGNLLRDLGRLDEAEGAYRAALLARPQYPEALNNYGALLKARGRFAEAELACRLSVQLRPDYVDALNNLGCVLTDLKRLHDAEPVLRKALELQPGHPEAHYNLGVVLQQQERYTEAEAAYRAALRVAPARAEILTNLGFVLSRMELMEEALAAFREALACDDTIAQTHFNLGSALKETGALEDAEAAYRHAIALDPDYGDALFRLATLLITMGHYEEGWRLYERRYENRGFIHFRSRELLACAHWQGEPLDGKSLLLWQEDGLGDMLQFSRYAELLKARGAVHVALACMQGLHRLLADVEGIDAVMTHEDAIARASEFACWASPLSLPLRLGTTLATTPPPTRFNQQPALIEKWSARLDALGPGPRIGLVWKGNPKHHNDHHRSIPSLAAMAPLWTVPGLRFVSLQKGAGEDDAQRPGIGQPLLHLGSEIEDFVDTAAIIAQLELVITVDTSTAHLAASLGKPCWVMLPGRDVDWRWLHGRDDSPWYPTVRLFRQGRDETWGTVIDRVRVACVQAFGA